MRRDVGHGGLSGIAELRRVGGETIKLHDDRKRDNDGPLEALNERGDHG